MAEITNIFVGFNSGQCGEFILSLLIGMHQHDKEAWRVEQLNVEQTGSCHTNRTHEPEIFARPRDELLEALSDFKTDELFVKLHTRMVNAHLVLENDPNAKLIQIIPDLHGERYLCNYVTKALLGEWDMYGRDAFNAEIGSNLTSKDEITKEHMDKLASGIGGIDDGIISIMAENSRKYPDRYFVLPLEWIYNDRQKLFSMLEYVSGCNRTKQTEDFYEEYIRKQPVIADFKLWWNNLT